MWGNRLGWTIAAFLAVGLWGAVLLIARGSSSTPPTQFSADEGNFKALKVPEPVASLRPTQDCDAAPLYRRAIEICLANRPQYEDFAAIGRINSQRAEKLDAIQPLLEASSCAGMNLFIAKPAEI